VVLVAACRVRAATRQIALKVKDLNKLYLKQTFFHWCASEVCETALADGATHENRGANPAGKTHIVWEKLQEWAQGTGGDSRLEQ
jgi:hypothetical protein